MTLQLKLELVPIPVSDVERAKAFYVDTLGFTLDVDATVGDGMRVVQVTPPGSACSIGFGTGMPVYESPVPARGLHLVVDDFDAARDELRRRGAEIGEDEGDQGGVRWTSFTDPDGNSFVLQQMAWRTGDAY